MYIVTNGSNYLMSDTKLTSHINEAKKYLTIALAEKARQSMKKTFKKIGTWIIIEYTETTQKREGDTTSLTKEETSSKIETDNNPELFKLAENIFDSYKKMLAYQMSLRAIVSEKDKETQDVLHFIEFYDLDAYNGYLIYKRLQKIRLERRKAKDEIARVDHFLNMNYKSTKQIKENKNKDKSYTPKVLTDLFKRKWKKHTEIYKEEREEIKDEEN